MKLPLPEPKKKFFQSIKTICINNKKIIVRFILLFLSAILGILFLIVFKKCFEAWLVCFLGLDPDSRFVASLQIILLGLPVFVLLWYFRTTDTKEQLDKSAEQIKKSAEQSAEQIKKSAEQSAEQIKQSSEQIKQSAEQSAEQINQNNYFKGLDNLVSKEQLKIEIAVQQLLELSKAAKKYKGSIKLAFIKRLKTPPNKEVYKEVNGEEKVRYFSYAQYIVDWLSENYLTKLNLTGCNFDYQEFKRKKNFGVFRKNKKKLEQLSFVEADLNGADLSGAKLIEAILSFANLNGASLSYANLSKADLNEAKLIEANLIGAKLIEANLSGADLSGANLSGADFTAAFFETNQQPQGIDFEKLGYKLEDVIKNDKICSKLVKKTS